MADLWERRFASEGNMWGETPSKTAVILNDWLEPRSLVAEFACGYGRDMIYLAGEGHRIMGYEAAASGREAARKHLTANGVIAGAEIRDESYFYPDLEEASVDAVLSHRALHLLNEGEVDWFAEASRYILKPGGLLCVSARDRRDFDPLQMTALDGGRGAAEYRRDDRQGHRIRFWSADLFHATLGDRFHLLRAYMGQEIEAVSNPAARAHFTVFLAQVRKDVG